MPRIPCPTSYVPHLISHVSRRVAKVQSMAKNLHVPHILCPLSRVASSMQISRQMGFSARDLQAFWLALSTKDMSSALVTPRNCFSPNVKVCGTNCAYLFLLLPSTRVQEQPPYMHVRTLARMHAHTQARAHARTHTHIHTYIIVQNVSVVNTNKSIAMRR